MLIASTEIDSCFLHCVGGHALLLITYIGLSALSFLTGFLGKHWIAIPVLALVATIPYLFFKPRRNILISKAQDNALGVWLSVVFSSHSLVLGLAYLVGLATG